MIDVNVPTEDQEGTESTVARWFKQIGEFVRQHEPLLELATDKATLELASPASGRLVEIAAAEGTPVSPGQRLGRIDESATTAATGPVGDTTAPPAVARATSSATAGAADLLSPAVRRLLDEHRLSPSDVVGTGRGGRITHQDVLDTVARRGTDTPRATTAASTPLASQRIPHTQMRRLIAEHMVESALKTAPHVTAVHECDLSTVVADRQRRQPEFAAEGVRLTLTAYFVKAASQALAAVPTINSRYHADALELLTSHNIGLATSLGADGLVVPVLHDVAASDLLALARSIDDLSQRARAGRLAPRETQLGTFTITNHGMGGSLIATPIINQPQVAILGLGKLQKRAVVVEQQGHDELAVRPMIYVTLTIDHRALDGFVANTFLQEFTRRLEHWGE